LGLIKYFSIITPGSDKILLQRNDSTPPPALSILKKQIRQKFGIDK
jgi:hypothetical protein